MLITPASVQMQQHIDAREGITDHFNHKLEKILNANKHKDKYWILGKAKIEKKKGKDIVRPFLEACDEKPGIIKESFVYEVDNRRGVKTLLWVMHPGDMLSFPTLGKSIRVTGGNTGSTILLPR
jgi:hypothetical protein